MTNSTSNDQKYLILACDGGGIRGLITAMLIQQLCADFSGLLTKVHLLAGTSTGGIISLALACNVSPDKLVDLYKNNGSSIFKSSACMPNPPSKPSGESLWEYIVTHVDEVICTWYDNSGLKSAIQSQINLPPTATLNSLVPSAPANPQYVLVNTFQLCNSNNVWTQLQLTNLPNIKDNDSGDTLVIDAAMSTSAAPMYFPPYPHPTYGYCADGGLFANNPGTIALTTLIESGVKLDNIWLLSLSTGNTLNSYPPSLINSIGSSGGTCGPLFWCFPVGEQSQSAYTPGLPLMSALFDGTSEVDDYQCGQLLGTRYQRARVPLSQPVELNDYSAPTIQVMWDSTNKYMQTSAEWAGIKTWLQNNFYS